MPRLNTLIKQHQKHFEATEKDAFDEARRLYQGDAWTTTKEGKDIDRRMFASKAIIFAIAETATASLIGPAPRVAPMPSNPAAKSLVQPVSGMMDWAFRVNRMRRRISTALLDSVLCSRGIFKTGWDEHKGQPVVRAVDPGALFFDLTARDPDDISYWLEATVVPWSRFAEMRDEGRFSKKAQEIKPDRYPRWLMSSRDPGQQANVIDNQRFVVVWEFYDVLRGRVVHYVEKNDVTLFEDGISYMPYSMFSLNQSGSDCSGISEVQILLNSQRTVNDLLTLWKRIVYLQVPKMFYDAGRITEDVINDSVRSPVGSYVPLHPKSSMSPDARFANLFYNAPIPEVPIGVKELLAKIEDDMAFTSALAEAARGRITGARTATEMMVMDAYNQTRLAARAGNMNEAIEDVARKVYVLCSKHLPTEKTFRIMGGRFAEVSVDTLSGVDMDFEMVPYNALRRNPAVILDTLIQMLPVISNAPNVVMPALIETLTDLLMLPGERFLLSAEQMEEQEANKQQADAQAQQAAGRGDWSNVRRLMGEVKPRAQGAASGGGVEVPSNLAEIENLRGEVGGMSSRIKKLAQRMEVP